MVMLASLIGGRGLSHSAGPLAVINESLIGKSSFGRMESFGIDLPPSVSVCAAAPDMVAANIAINIAFFAFIMMNPPQR